MAEHKKWYESKLIWLGAMQIAIAVFTAVDAGVSWPQCVLAGLGAACIALRAVTSLPLSK